MEWLRTHAPHSDMVDSASDKRSCQSSQNLQKLFLSAAAAGAGVAHAGFVLLLWQDLSTIASRLPPLRLLQPLVDNGTGVTSGGSIEARQLPTRHVPGQLAGDSIGCLSTHLEPATCSFASRGTPAWHSLGKQMTCSIWPFVLALRQANHGT